jgi:hypothetical protein
VLTDRSRRHAKTVHKLNYCRDCCVFYGDAKSKFCPGCQRFCMSPTCFHAAPTIGTGALSQRHERTSRCPSVWGRTSGVPDEQLLDYLRRLGNRVHVLVVLILGTNILDLDLDRQSQGDNESSRQPGAAAEPSANNSPDCLNVSIDPMCIDHDEVSFPRMQYNTGKPATSDLASCPTKPVDNIAPATASPYRVLTQTANPWTTFPNNAQPLPVMSFDILGDDPAAWVWDGVFR